MLTREMNKKILLLCVAVGLFVISYFLGNNYFSSQAMSYYSGVFATFLVYFFCWILTIPPDKKYAKLLRPSSVFLVVFGYFFGLGTLNHVLQVFVGAKFTFEIFLNSGYHFIIVALVSWVLGYSLSRSFCYRMRVANRIKHRVWDKRKLKTVLIFSGILSSVFFGMFLFRHIGGIPILMGVAPAVSGNIRNIVKNEGRVFNVLAMNFNTYTILFSSIFIANYKDISVKIVFFVSLLWFVAWGARLYFLIPLLVFLLILQHKKIVKLKKVVLISVAILVVVGTYGIIRNFKFFDLQSNSYSGISVNYLLADMHLGSEFRDYLDVVGHLDEVKTRYDSNTFFKGMFLSAIPKVIADKVGLDKDLFLDPEASSGWIIAEMLRGSMWTGIRAGILAELLMAFGVSGLIVGFFLLGLLFGFLDTTYLDYNVNNVKLIFIYFITVLFSYIILGTVDSVFARFWYFVYAYFLFRKVASKVECRDYRIVGGRA